MSASLMSAAMYLPITKSEKLLLVAMTDHANDDGLGVYPGNPRLATKTSDSIRNMQKVLARLEELELILKDKHPFGGRGLAVEWAINADMIYSLAKAHGWTQKRVSSRTPFTERKGDATAQKGDATAQNHAPGDTPTVLNVIPTEPEPLSLAEQNPRKAAESMADYLSRIAQLYDEPSGSTSPTAKPEPAEEAG